MLRFQYLLKIPSDLKDCELAVTEDFLSSEPQEGQKAGELARALPQEGQKLGLMDTGKVYIRKSKNLSIGSQNLHRPQP